MAKVIIFGNGDMAKIAKFYLDSDSSHEVCGFCLEMDGLVNSISFEGLPLINFADIEKIFPADSFKMFAPLPSDKMNVSRQRIFNLIKKKGYEMISYVSSKSVVYSSFIGENCFIQAGNVMHPFTKIGNNVMLWSSNLVGHHGVVLDHVTFASHVALAGNCIVGENCYLGTNSTIRDGIHLAKGTLVGIGTVITKNTEDWSVYMGNPAKKIGNNISKSILKI